MGSADVAEVRREGELTMSSASSAIVQSKQVGVVDKEGLVAGGESK